jgi:hypothetical protein
MYPDKAVEIFYSPIAWEYDESLPYPTNDYKYFSPDYVI